MGSYVGPIVYFIFIVGVFYFLLIRPQQKQRKERDKMMSSLSINDKVYTVGGILGTITKVNTNTVNLKVADKVEIEVLKTSVGGTQAAVSE